MSLRSVEIERGAFDSGHPYIVSRARPRRLPVCQQMVVAR